MIRRRFWHSVPAGPVGRALAQLTWKRSERRSPAAGIAALMLYVALNFSAEDREEYDGRSASLVQASYEDLADATGISRSLTSQGLQLLQGARPDPCGRVASEAPL